MSIIKEPIAELVWDSKYRYRYRGVVLDQTIEDTWRRVAQAVAHAEKKAVRTHWQDAFYRILEGFKFLPGGRILAGAGTKHDVTLFNCFVMNIPEDSLTGIFVALKEGALTLQQGGGIGYDFSVLRPKGALVKKTGVTASGPVSFMRIWDTMCATLLSTGARRGAMMGVLRCDHPDIQDFITAKREAGELRHFNVSVMVTNDFMAAVEADQDWPLVFPIARADIYEHEVVYKNWRGENNVPCRVYARVRARELWQQIIHSAYDYAEPGVLFADTINHKNNLWYREYIGATNPCGEIPLPAYGACNLGSLNLTQFVRAPFTEHASLDFVALEETAQIATRFLDNVIDISRYPLPAQSREAKGTRRIGLGITGLADACVMLGLPYGSEASITFAAELMQRVATVTWETSIALAREKGPFPFFQPDYLQGEFVRELPQDLQSALREYGVRNSHHNAIAPTGTISLLANNVSNGIEPIFKAHYNRHVRGNDGETLTYAVSDYAYQLWRAEEHDGLPKAWRDIDTLSPDAHLLMQAAVQPYIDNAISKTINLPRDFPFIELAEVYSKAYALGLKGCTVFRPNPVTGSVLDVPEEHCCQFEGDLNEK